MRGGLSISHGTNIVTLPFRKREETGNTKLFLKLRDVHLLDYPFVDYEDLKKIKEIIKGFKKRDYYVTLGSLLDDDTREYYKKNKFAYLFSIIDEWFSYRRQTSRLVRLY